LDQKPTAPDAQALSIAAFGKRRGRRRLLRSVSLGKRFSQQASTSLKFGALALFFKISPQGILRTRNVMLDTL